MRENCWDKKVIAPWYRQNSFIFIHESKKEWLKLFKPTSNPLYLVHYGMWEIYMEHIKYLEQEIKKWQQESQKWQNKYHKTLAKRVEFALKSIKSKIKGKNLKI